MRQHLRARHALRAAALTASVAVLGAGALPAHAAGSPASWRALFPPVAAYPHGARVQPVQTSARADALVDPATAAHVARLGFTTGGTQYATLRAQALVGVTVLVFRTERGAATFLRQDQPSALADPTTPGTTAGGLVLQRRLCKTAVFSGKSRPMSRLCWPSAPIIAAIRVSTASTKAPLHGYWKNPSL